VQRVQTGGSGFPQVVSDYCPYGNIFAWYSQNRCAFHSLGAFVKATALTKLWNLIFPVHVVHDVACHTAGTRHTTLLWQIPSTGKLVRRCKRLQHCARSRDAIAKSWPCFSVSIRRVTNDSTPVPQDAFWLRSLRLRVSASLPHQYVTRRMLASQALISCFSQLAAPMCRQASSQWAALDLYFATSLRIRLRNGHDVGQSWPIGPIGAGVPGWSSSPECIGKRSAQVSGRTHANGGRDSRHPFATTPTDLAPTTPGSVKLLQGSLCSPGISLLEEIFVHRINARTTRWFIFPGMRHRVSRRDDTQVVGGRPHRKS